MKAATYGLRSKISPTMEINEIIIKLNPEGAPVTELRGKISTGKLEVDRSSGATITTRMLTPAGRAFIAEMKDAFKLGNTEGATDVSDPA